MLRWSEKDDDGCHVGQRLSESGTHLESCRASKRLAKEKARSGRASIFSLILIRPSVLSFPLVRGVVRQGELPVGDSCQPYGRTLPSSNRSGKDLTIQVIIFLH
jgi:hypothetical protein